MAYVTDLEELHNQALGMGNAMIKSVTTDPKGRVAIYLYNQLAELIERDLPEDADELRDHVIVALRLIALFTRFTRDIVRMAAEGGVTIPVDFASPYDALFAIEEIGEPS
ncbi:MAG: hypothetical protein ACRDZR_01170 [Acidimicrobiales bacterium]